MNVAAPNTTFLTRRVILSIHRLVANAIWIYISSSPTYLLDRGLGGFDLSWERRERTVVLTNSFLSGSAMSPFHFH